MYAREFEGKDYNFGVIGVDKGTLILYDDETRSRWSQLMGKAVSGEMAGETLEKFASTMTTWEQWRSLHPTTTVYAKPSIPYSARFTSETFRKIATAGEGPVRPEDLVVALEGHVEARAYLVRRLAKQRLLHDVFEGTPVVVYLSPDLSTAKVFSRIMEGRQLTFQIASDGQLEDEETHSRWLPITGECVDGTLEDKYLQPLVSTYSLWFAWEKYRPDTTIYE